MTTLTSTTDCLIFKIEEYVDNTLDTTLFVLYDKNEETYLIIGKRSDFNGKEAVSYSFNCYYSKELSDFISFIVCPKSKLSYTLFSYNDLPLDNEEIDYNYLNNLDNNKLYEVAGYDNQKYNKKQIVSILKFLKYVFNIY
jgi:hypothetical protein